MAHPDHDPDVGDVIVVPWTAGLALRVVAADQGAVTVDAIRASAADGVLPVAAVAALARAGWTARAAKRAPVARQSGSCSTGSGGTPTDRRLPRSPCV